LIECEQNHARLVVSDHSAAIESVSSPASRFSRRTGTSTRSILIGGQTIRMKQNLLQTTPQAHPFVRSKRRRGAAHEVAVVDIEELKKKHGIDYDSHGSYWFVEE
jgi:hypothetical protein